MARFHDPQFKMNTTVLIDKMLYNKKNVSVEK